MTLPALSTVKAKEVGKKGNCKVQQLISLGVVHQQVDPLVLAHTNAHQR